MKLREQYVAHVTRMFTLLGDSPDKAVEEAASVLKVETALAQGSMARVDMRTPIERLPHHDHRGRPGAEPGIQLDGSADRYRHPSGEDDECLVAWISQDGQRRDRDRAAAGAEVVYALVDPALESPRISRKIFPTPTSSSLARPLQGQKEQQPRWKRCTRLTDGALGEAVGQDWVKENFPPAAKADMEKLVLALRKALKEDIAQLPWMSDATKAEAEKKLAAFRQKIGYPATWRDYSKFEVSRVDFVADLERNAVFERNRNMARLGKPVDETEWGMTPPTVNAYYSPQMNDINFPAGILQPPFYDVTKDPAINFGGIGMVIGHEMTHGFDDQGSNFGPTGNVRYKADGSMDSWFTADDLAKFKGAHLLRRRRILRL